MHPRCARGDCRKDVGGVGDERHGPCAAFGHRPPDRCERLRERVRDLVYGTAFEPLGRALRIDFDGNARRAQHGGRARLCGAHASESGREKKSAAEVRGAQPGGGAREYLEGALQNTLRADVLPTPRGEPAPADESALLEVVEHLFVGPAADEVAIRHEYERRTRVRGEDRDGFARLNDQGLVVGQGLERVDDRLVGGRLRAALPSAAYTTRFCGSSPTVSTFSSRRKSPSCRQPRHRKGGRQRHGARFGHGLFPSSAKRAISMPSARSTSGYTDGSNTLADSAMRLFGTCRMRTVMPSVSRPALTGTPAGVNVVMMSGRFRSARRRARAPCTRSTRAPRCFRRSPRSR